MAQKAKLKVKGKKSKFAEFIRAEKINLLIQLLLISVIVTNVGSTVWNLRDKYLSSDYWQRFPSLKKAYYDSIYANKKGGFLPDETLYSFNGGALIQGTSPILVNPEIPPTGKYIVGLSALIFKNEHIVIPIAGILSLILIFLLGRQIFSTSLIALIPPSLLSFEPIFKNQFIFTPLLDIIHLVFLLLSFYFFNLAFRKKKSVFVFFLFTSLFFGLFISTKFFGIGISVFLAFVAVLVINKKFKRLKLFLISTPVSVLVLLFSYIRVLAIGYPLSKFFGIQKWVFWYNQGHLRLPFSVWPLLLLNKWFVSWSTSILSDPQWRITWPIITVLSLSTIVIYFLLKEIPRKIEAEVLMIWVLLYLIFLSFGDANARYFVILIPIMYLISVFGIKILLGNLLLKYIKRNENSD